MTCTFLQDVFLIGAYFPFFMLYC